MISEAQPAFLGMGLQGDNLVVFDRRTLKHIATLSTCNKAILHLEYNRARDEIISGGSDGCHVWRLAPAPYDLYAPGIVR